MKETICPNCGAIRPDAFCSQCGQNSRDYNTPFWAIIRDALSEMFEFDGRVAKSLRTILLQPGQLAVAFAENKRASFVNPFRLLMFTTIVWFFLFGIALDPPLAPPDSELVRTDENYEKFNSGELETSVAAGLEIMRSALEGDRKRKLEDILRPPEDSPRKFAVNSAAGVLQDNPDMWDWLRRVVANAVVDGAHSPQKLMGDALDNLPLMMFVLLPWYAFLLMVFYMRRGKRFVHHLVFAIHVHSFYFIVSSFTLLTPAPIDSEVQTWWTQMWEMVDSVVVLFLAVHTYFAFKRFYGDGYVKTILKYVGLGILYAWGLIPAFVLVVALTLAEYL